MKLGHLDIPSDVCRSVGNVLGRIGDKWSVLVIVLLSERSHRFSELRRTIGTVSQKMLTATLRGLERDGYLTRTVTPTIPPRVDYALTEMGRDVLTPLNALAHWALAHREQVEAARRAYDAKADASAEPHLEDEGGR
ncbi:helix-turn-helix transcriptional regulator [Corallococcus sp. ZKHCc1 1396]|uniref:Helix-turn-helix transcriptional regulator n=1 Tax=Corallococcus soli TaxID=2710757 RepID=A0ABR9PHW8_9BACT|nr:MULTISPECIES: helix-turn-helix domain-containing protein [Corallococcus]MBE4747526.1 helix-turn-helix transcriptional regulator [Corallococcus soli]MCY1031750.1 helix-turn-helix domain-containing protein [Corallococcus sp. BB11-1]